MGVMVGAMVLLGGLIQAASGTVGGRGATPLQRAGWAMKAASSLTPRCSVSAARAAVAHGIGRHECDAGMPMFGVVALKKLSPMRTNIFDRTETRREIRPVFQSREMRFGKRIVIRAVRTAVSCADIQTHKQLRYRLRAHAGAAVRMQGQRASARLSVYQSYWQSTARRAPQFFGRRSSSASRSG